MPKISRERLTLILLFKITFPISSIAVELRLERPDLCEAEILGLVVVELSEPRLELRQVEAASRVKK